MILQQYITLLTEWKTARAIQGHPNEDGFMVLSVERDSDYSNRLTDLWYQMSPEDQNTAEIFGAEAFVMPLGAPETLGLVDVVAQSGKIPRKHILN